jgi:hypothetical protein|tara:strand:- start:242 stop:352 length:111 start_codon:yes stop_codon:yes gene_type:complete
MPDKYKKFLIIAAHPYPNPFIKIKNKKLIIKTFKID